MPTDQFRPFKHSRRALLGDAVAGAFVAPTVAQMPLAAPTPRFVVVPNPVAEDEPVAVRLIGFVPDAAVVVRAAVVDAVNVTWEAWAEYRTDERGAVDLAAQSPCAGTHADSDPMALLWSAEPLGVAAGTTPFLPPLWPGRLRLTAEVAGAPVARVDVARGPTIATVASVDLRAGGLVGRLFRPVGASPVPAVLVLGGSEGGLSPFILRQAALLASHGYAALALAYFGLDGLPPALANVPLEYFDRAAGLLGDRPDVAGDRLAVLGVSRGGEVALLLAATFPRFRAAVSVAGSGLVVRSPDGATPAWTLRGQPLPFAVGNEPAGWDAAAIPVERIDGPVLLLSGE